MSKFLQAAARVEVESEVPARMMLAGVDRQPLRDPDGTTYYIDLLGADSESARRHQRRVTNRRLAMKGRGKVTAEEIEADAIELLVALTAGWGSINASGVAEPDPDFNEQAARGLYSDPKKAEVRSQVDEFIAERTNFSKALSTNSSNTPNTSSGKAKD